MKTTLAFLLAATISLQTNAAIVSLTDGSKITGVPLTITNSQLLFRKEKGGTTWIDVENISGVQFENQAPAREVQNRSATNSNPQKSRKTDSDAQISVAGVTIGNAFVKEGVGVTYDQIRKGLSSHTTTIEETKVSKGKSVSVTTRRVYRTVYTNKGGIAVAVQVSFENVSADEMDSIIKSLDDKYSRERQVKNDCYNYTIGKTGKLETTVAVVSGAIVKHTGKGSTYVKSSDSHTRYRVTNFYYADALLEKAMKEASDENATSNPNLI